MSLTARTTDAITVKAQVHEPSRYPLRIGKGSITLTDKTSQLRLNGSLTASDFATMNLRGHHGWTDTPRGRALSSYIRRRRPRSRLMVRVVLRAVATGVYWNGGKSSSNPATAKT